jgi:hypothetical protein
MFTQIIINPGHGFSDGIFEPGNGAFGNRECDLIDTFVEYLETELRTEAIPIDIVPSRTWPGISEKNRGNWCIDNSFVVHIHMRHQLTKSRQCALVYHSGCEGIANAIADTIGLWGSKRTSLWEGCRVQTAKFPWFNSLETCAHIQIEPVNMAGQDFEILFADFRYIATECAKKLSLWFKTQNPNIKFQGDIAWGVNPLNRNP